MTYTYSYSPWLTLYSTCLELVAAPRARARTGTGMGMARTRPRPRPRTWTFPALEDRSSESRATRLLLAEEEACELRAARAAVFPTRCARSCQVPDARTRTPGARSQEPGAGRRSGCSPLAAGCCPVPYAHPVVATDHDRRQGDSSQRRRPTIYVRRRVQKALATRDLSQEPTLSLLLLSSSTWAGVMSVHAHGEAEGQGHGRGRVDVDADAAAWRGCGPGPLGRHEWGPRAIVRRTTPGARGSLEK